jgi:hypothetical protein
MIVLVRDAKTGLILVEPPESELWLLREKSGVGRAAKNEWNVLKEVGPDLFKEMDDHRRWHLGFTDYYDVYVWQVGAGLGFMSLYTSVQEVSSFGIPFKATAKKSLLYPSLSYTLMNCARAVRCKLVLIDLVFADFVRLLSRHIVSFRQQTFTIQPLQF